MTWRIERTDALTLLRELPSEWAQTCIAYPPCGAATARTLAMLTEIHRIMRADGALWLFLPSEALRGELSESGWVEQRPPGWVSPVKLMAASVRPVVLLTREASYFHRPDSIAPQRSRAFPPRRPGWHVPRVEQGHEAIRGLAGRCVLTTTARAACRICGAPHMQSDFHTLGSACVHRNAAGRCFVLDPWYHAAHGTLEATRQNGRTFLGIVDTGHGESE